MRIYPDVIVLNSLCDCSSALQVPNDLFERLAAIPVGDEEKTVANLRFHKGSVHSIHHVPGTSNEKSCSVGPDSDRFEIVLPADNQPAQPIASSSKTPAASSPPTHPEDNEIVYALERQKDVRNSARWMYLEDERRHRWSGKSTERGEQSQTLLCEREQKFTGTRHCTARPRLLAKVVQTHVLKRTMSQAASTRVLKAAMLKDQEKKRYVGQREGEIRLDSNRPSNAPLFAGERECLMIQISRRRSATSLLGEVNSKVGL